MPPVLALLTDFGLADPYVAAMKGVILGLCPEVTLVDVTHDIRPQAVLEASMTLEACYSWFPPRTVFVAVVDPGVGTGRRALAVDASGYRFVAPDNGLLTGVLRRAPSLRAVELTERAYWREPVSATFEGRDKFAPVGAWLCRDLALERLGPAADNLHRVAWPTSAVFDGVLQGVIVCADRFGNLLTSIDRGALDAFNGQGPLPAHVHVEGLAAALPLVRTYGDLEPGRVGALVGSGGWLELCERDGSAAARLGNWADRRVRVGAAFR